MSPGVEFEERMSESDAVLWNNERDPMLRSTIVSLMILDQAPDPERLRGAIDRSLEHIPRLRQRVSLDPLGVAPPCWEEDPYFNLAYHYRHLRAPGEGSLRDLLDLAEPVAMQAFDKDRPLWELHLVDGLEGGRTALLMKLHHSISDGVGLVRMTSSLVERSREPDPEREGRPRSVGESAPETAKHGPFEQTLLALRHRAETNLHWTTAAARATGAGVGALLRHPLQALDDGRRLVGSLGRLLQPVSEPLSPILTGRSLAVRFDTLAMPLDDLKRAGKAVGGSLNDAFVAAMAGGLRLYHEHHGHPVDELRMTLPINLRQGEEGRRAGNQFVPARFPVPVGVADPAARIRAIGERVRRERAEPALPLTETVSGVISRLPRAVSVSLLGSMLKAIDFITSNVPGPPFPVYASGARVERMFGFGPLSGAAANVTAFSYDGDFELGINSDRAAVPDPDFFTECLAKGVNEVLSVA